MEEKESLYEKYPDCRAHVTNTQRVSPFKILGTHTRKANWLLFDKVKSRYILDPL